MAIVQPSWAKNFRTRLHSTGLFINTYILNIGNMGLVYDKAGGALVNARSSTATVIDFEGNVVECLPNEIRYSGGRRVDHADGIMYNAGVLGIEYFDTESDGTTLISPAPSILHEGEGTNYAWPSSTPATQTITLAAGDYTVWLDDTDDLGTITLTGGATGTANSTDINGFQFTSTGAAITFTHAGSNNVRWQVEGGDYRTSYIETTTAALTRAADDLYIPLVDGGNFVQEQGILVFDWTVGADFNTSTASQGLLGLRHDVAQSLLYIKGTAGNLRSSDASTELRASQLDYSTGDRIKVAVCWNEAEPIYSINYSLDQGVSWSTWTQATYDGEFTFSTDIKLFLNNPYINNLHSAKLYGTHPGNGTIADAQAWVEGNA